MEIKLFFEPIDEPLVSTSYAESDIFHSLSIHAETTPIWKDMDIAIIGVPEDSGTTTNKGCDNGPDEFRKKFYRLKKGTGSWKIVDLGNLKPGIEVLDTHMRLKVVCHTLIEHNVLPVIIGGSHDLDMGQYGAYADMDKLISVLQVDACFDMGDDESQLGLSSSHTREILLYEPNFLFHFSHLGFQTYLNSNETTELFEKLHFDSYRIGAIRENIKAMEPVIRNCDMMSFDISAIRAADAPGNNNAKPFGLSGEEACQICWYAGLNDKLSSVGFYEYNPEKDINSHTAEVLATMVWYFVEGFYNRKGEGKFKENDFLRYHVAFPGDSTAIVFFKSKLSEKWWMEVPYPETEKQHLRKAFMLPCSYEDYLLAVKGEIPNRWINAFAKLC